MMDESKDFSKGVIAWALLVCCWFCMLVDDLQSVLPESLRISTRGLTTRMNRTKTRVLERFTVMCMRSLNVVYDSLAMIGLKKGSIL